MNETSSSRVPSRVWVVIDELGLTRYCALLSDDCHDHINAALIDSGVEEAAEWIVRPYTLETIK